ncbi:folate-binding protein YgfZ [Candidatus Uabimicrobium sp. HlEnr_7]|uniref:CAF17-like 4Fe-4S cluster assembly/insertion protein YgfZ n=1 Tax=Candidatus Uabimicrobium helgolandensis TaxID=3095367 RepID=UPI003556719A
MSDLTKYLKSTSKKISTCSQPLVYNLEHLCIIEICGKDVISFLQRMTTNNIESIHEKGFVATIFTNDKGRIIDSVYLLKFEKKLLMICHKIYREKLIAWIDKYTILDDVTVQKTDDYFLWQVWNYQIAKGSQIKSFNISMGNVSVNWFIGMKSQQKSIVENLSNANANICENNAYEYYRIQENIPTAPNEIHDLINPHEINFLDRLDFEKGCYVGQEVIARLDTYDKVQKYLRRFSCDHKNVKEGSSIYSIEGKSIGNVTSISNLEEKTIGLLFIRKKFIENKQLMLENGEKITIE